MQSEKVYTSCVSDIVSRLNGVVTLALLTTLCGCSNFRFICRFYDGPERSLREIAVLYSPGEPIFITKIDGVAKSPFKYNEYHLEPGEHSITAYYALGMDFEGFYYYGEEKTIVQRFEKGYVYRTQAFFPAKWKEKRPSPKEPHKFEKVIIDWQLKVKKLGTVEEPVWPGGRS